MKIILVHGYNVRDYGAGTVDRLAQPLRAAGHDVDTDSGDYGYFDLRSVRFHNKYAIRRLAQALEDADVVINHSNGAHFTRKAMAHVTNPPRYAIRLSPALNRRAGPGEGVRQCHVFHTRDDFWVGVSALLLFHSWGWQGKYGYKGTDKRMVNHDFSGLITSHSCWFDEKHAYYIATRILTILEKL